MKFFACVFVVTAVAVVGLGCGGGGAIPVGKLASAESALRGAQEVGAEKTPQGALHLRFAREQLDTAKKLIAEGDMDRAMFVLLRAEADAEAALSLARETNARAEAQKAVEDLKALKTKTERAQARREEST